MILNFNQLNCFVAVAEELHFGRAAARLFMTQPPLTRQIQLLEHALGVKLFERTSRTVRLTTAGQVFLVDATRLLNSAEQAATSAQRASKGEIGRVTIGFIAMAGLELIPQLVDAAQRVLPNIDVVLKEMVSVDQLEALTANAIDLAFVRPLPTRQVLECQTVAREPLLLALPADHPLAARSQIQPDDLNGLPFVMYTPTGGKNFHGLITGLFGAAGVVPNYIQHLDLAHTILALVRTGLGVSIVPASAAQLHFDNVVFRPLWRDDVIAETNMAWRLDQRNPALATFRHFALDYFAGQSLALHRLRERGLLVGRGSRTDTSSGPAEAADALLEQARLPRALDAAPLEGGKAELKGCMSGLATFLPDLATMPPELATFLDRSRGKTSKDALRQLIVQLCAWQPLTGEQLAALLNRDRHYLRNKHLPMMVGSGQLALLYPENVKHPHQAYVTPANPRQAERG